MAMKPTTGICDEPTLAPAPPLPLRQDGDRSTRLTRRQRFLSACHCQHLDYPPVWLMRQAGRVLPEYRALKERYSFLDLIRTPELATEVTLQPIRRFGFDAAILFSDILVVAEALGHSFRFQETGGVFMESILATARDVAQLDPSAIPDQTAYVGQTLALIRRELGNETALLGFAGSPWTVANFMLEGGSAKEFTKAKLLFYNDRPLFDLLLDKLTDATIAFLNLQIDAGVDAVQIFDSLGGTLSDYAYPVASAASISKIIRAINSRVPVLLFAKGVHGCWETLANSGAHVLSVDWTVPLADLRGVLPPQVGVQGNLDPCVLNTTPEIVRTETQRLLDRMRGRRGHIFNLGHGVPPTAKLENIEALVSTVRNLR